MNITIREMTIADYDSVYALWSATEGVGLSDSDSKEGVEKYLRHNPESSFVAFDGVTLIGAIMCGHDGRRGFLHHLAVAKSHRRMGIGRLLVEKSLHALREKGILKCHLVAYKSNDQAREFWKKIGWRERDDLTYFATKIT